jgi:hypothetical protein
LLCWLAFIFNIADINTQRDDHTQTKKKSNKYCRNTPKHGNPMYELRPWLYAKDTINCLKDIS